MGTGALSDQASEQERHVLQGRRQPYLIRFNSIYIWPTKRLRAGLSVIFAPWPSMHNPVESFLNAADTKEADRLTEKWTEGKLKELQYVGLSVRGNRHLILCDIRTDDVLLPECSRYRYHRLCFLLEHRSRRSMEYRGMLDKCACTGLDSHQPCQPANYRSDSSVHV